MSTPPRRGRGRPPSTIPAKRHAAGELSTNPHTLKARKRMEGLSDAEKQVARLENTMAVARSRALAKLRKTQEWLEGDEGMREYLETQARLTVESARYACLASGLFIY